MYINFYKSAFSEKATVIETTAKKIKDVETLKNINFANALIYVNGFQKDENYELKENDVCTIRYFPASAEGFVAWWNQGTEWVTSEIKKAGETLKDSITNTCKWLISEALKNLGVTNNYTYNNSYTTNNIDNSTHITENYIQANNAVKSPDVRGCSNKSNLDSCYPLVIGKSYYSPVMLALPYSTPADAYGRRQTYHALFNMGYNNVNVTDICLGLKKITSNSAKTRNGAIAITDSDFTEAELQKYDIHLEIQTSDEVSLYSQKVVQEDIGTELTFPDGDFQHGLILDKMSSTYPQRVDLEFYLDALVGKDSDGKESTGSLSLKVEYSLDGGNTYQFFGQIGVGVAGSSYNALTGETTLTMKDYHSMRLIASKTFTAGEVFNATNHVVEFRIQRTTKHVDDNYIYDTVSLAKIRTWCYDPDKSTSSNLVAQTPVCEKDRTRLTRLGFTITTDDYLYDLGQFNCMVQALGRTCTESNGYYTWSDVETETCNPASMALKVLQSPMLGEYVYSDSEIDLQSFGELYKFCDEYNISDAKGNHTGLCSNGIVTSQTKLSDLLNQILSVGRASRIIANDKISLFIDKPITYTTLILNNQNVLQASNSKNFDELPSGIKAKFINEDNFSQNDTMYIDYEDAPARSDIHYKTQEKNFVFQTNVEQIKKNGLYELAKLKLRPETWERKVTTEGYLAYVGAKIEVQDDTISVGIGDGAEIKALVFDDENNPAYITGIVTDGEFDVTDLTQEYGVRIQQTSLVHGILSTTKKVVFEESGIYNTFVFDEPISLEEAVVPCIGDILSFGIYSKITYESICIGKNANGDGTFNLTLIPYVEDIYNADAGVLPEFNSMTSAPSYAQPLPQKDPVTQEDIQGVIEYVDTGSTTAPTNPSNFTAVFYQNRIEMKCLANGDKLSDCVKYFEFEITKGVGETPVVIKSATNNFDYIFDRGTDGYPEQSVLSNWSFRVRVINVYEIESDWVNCSNVSFVNYGTWQPDTPSFIRKDADEGGINFSWESAVGVSNKQLYGNNTYEVALKYDNVLRKTIVTESLNAVYNFKRTGTNADGYPEKPDTPNLPQGTPTLDLYTVKLKVTNESGKYAESTETIISYGDYKTWIPPTITSVTKEVVDRTIFLTALYNAGAQFYGNLKTLVKISRKGNLDSISGQTFNEYLGITQDVVNDERVYYTPEFDKSVQTSNSADNEPNYRKDTTTAYVSMGYKFSHTLPLIGQTYRIFKDGVFTGTFTKDVSDYSTVPTSPIAEGLIIHYVGAETGHFTPNFYYMAVATEVEPSGEENPSEEGWYELDNDSYILSEDTSVVSGKTYYAVEWVQVFSNANIVPTTYVYSLQFTNESGNVSNLMDDIEATAQCTNIADIVHCHEHYKDLYVEKLSAITENVGLITQGGFGAFKDWKNFWALSDLSAEDSGVAGGVKKGSFRVGGDDQYFEVMPDPDKEGEYIITLKAGNITLTSNADASFKQGTYIYDNIDPNKRLALTSTGIIAQQKVNGEWTNLAEVRTDDVGNMIITNGGDTPEVGVKVTGDIYHFENASAPFNAESNTNPQAVSGTGQLISTENENPLIRPSSSEKCFSGTVEKDVSQFTGNIVFFSKANLVFEGGKYIRKNGAIENDNQTAYNELMRQAKGQSTVGAYLGLTQTQIDNGIFTEE